MRKACVVGTLTTWLSVHLYPPMPFVTLLSSIRCPVRKKKMSAACAGHSLSAPVLVLPQQFPSQTEKWVRGSLMAEDQALICSLLSCHFSLMVVSGLGRFQGLRRPRASPPTVGSARAVPPETSLTGGWGQCPPEGGDRKVIRVSVRFGER